RWRRLQSSSELQKCTVFQSWNPLKLCHSFHQDFYFRSSKDSSVSSCLGLALWTGSSRSDSSYWEVPSLQLLSIYDKDRAVLENPRSPACYSE
ncbi:unnamed protein product, partial [Cyprideis torosa]